jgi:hypothetical protein
MMMIQNRVRFGLAFGMVSSIDGSQCGAEPSGSLTVVVVIVDILQAAHHLRRQHEGGDIARFLYDPSVDVSLRMNPHHGR